MLASDKILLDELRAKHKPLPDCIVELRSYFNSHDSNKKYNEQFLLSGNPLPYDHVAVLPNHNIAFLEASKASQLFGVQLYVYDNRVFLFEQPLDATHKNVTVYHRPPKLNPEDTDTHNQIQFLSDLIANEPSDRAVEASIVKNFGLNETDLYEVIQQTRNELAEISNDYRSMTNKDIKKHIVDVVTGKADRLRPNWHKPKTLDTPQYNKHKANGIVRCHNMELARQECRDRITLTGKHDPEPENRPLESTGRWVNTGETYVKTVVKDGKDLQIQMPVKTFIKHKKLDMIERPRSVALCKHVHPDPTKRLGFFAIDNYEPERDPREELYGKKEHWNVMERYTWDPDMKVFPVDDDKHKFQIQRFTNGETESELPTYSITYRNWMGDTGSLTRTAMDAESARKKALRWLIETGQSGDVVDIEVADADTLSETTVDTMEILFHDEYEQSVEQYLHGDEDANREERLASEHRNRTNR